MSNGNMVTKIAIIEDNADIRKQLMDLVQAAPGFECPYIYDRAETALRQLPMLKPDVILMDIGLPKMSGVECTALLHQALPQTPILIVTVFNDSNRIFKALQAGASGYLLKEVVNEELIQAIAAVTHGDAPMSGAIALKVIEYFRRPTVSVEEDTKLSAREEEMLTWLARGYSNKEIGDHLAISINTVRTHLQRIYKKLHVRGRMEAVAKHKSVGGFTPDSD
jgi:DNA-binding NarL/FixJ family response regulator